MQCPAALPSSSSDTSSGTSSGTISGAISRGAKKASNRRLGGPIPRLRGPTRACCLVVSAQQSPLRFCRTTIRKTHETNLDKDLRDMNPQLATSSVTPADPIAEAMTSGHVIKCGFYCPSCKVDQGSAEALQSHFFAVHSQNSEEESKENRATKQNTANTPERQGHKHQQLNHSQKNEIKYTEHTIVKGDTVQGLCLRYKVSAAELRQVNPGFRGGNLAWGACVKIPSLNRPTKVSSNKGTATKQSNTQSSPQASTAVEEQPDVEQAQDTNASDKMLERKLQETQPTIESQEAKEVHKAVAIKKNSSLDVDVLGHSQLKDARGKEFTSYDVKVTRDGVASLGGTYLVAKRYSQFQALHGTIRREIPCVSFPKADWFGNVNKAKRCEDLNAFLVEVCSTPMSDESLEALGNFLREEPDIAAASEEGRSYSMFEHKVAESSTRADFDGRSASAPLVLLSWSDGSEPLPWALDAEVPAEL
jgi:hypothetical protein